MTVPLYIYTMTPSERIDYLFKWHRFQQRHERIYTPKFKQALQKQLKEFTHTKDVMRISSEPIYKVLEDLYTTVGPLWAGYTGVHRLRNEHKALLPMGFSDRIVELMRNILGINLRNLAETITQYTREVILRVLSESTQSGASFDMIVKELEADSELGAMRARRIARTETVTASNAAALINAQESGLLMKKEWMAVEDKRTRHSHKEIDGTVIALNQAYDLNGVLMMHPGIRTQPNGLEVPEKEFVNCRCTQGFIPVRDSAGRLVRV